MSQPVPEFPTNVESKNPYTGLDRGLFKMRGDGALQYGRIHAVRIACKGPAAAIGILEYQVMAYATKPTTAAQYAAGTLQNAPDGTKWFDCLSRGSVISPIVAEYWAIGSFLTWYTNPENGKLTQGEKDLNNTQAQTFVTTMGSWCGLEGIEFETTFDAVAGQSLTRTSMNLGIDYRVGEVAKHIDEANLPTTDFDPVRVALNILKTA